MSCLTKPVIEAWFYNPGVYGMTKTFGSSKIYRFNKDFDWELRNLEKIDSLNCLSVFGDKSPKSMADWKHNPNLNNSWEVVYPDYLQPTYSFRFTDGTVHSSNEPLTDIVGTIYNPNWSNFGGNFVISFRRFNPPIGQEVATILSGAIAGVERVWNSKENKYYYEPGKLSLAIPLGKISNDGYYFTKPFIHWIKLSEITGDAFNFLTQGTILTELSVSTSDHGTNEVWSFEHLTDWSLYPGSHMLISSAKLQAKKQKINEDESNNYMHYWNKDITVANKTIWDALDAQGLLLTGYSGVEYLPTCSCQGSICTINMSEITYNIQEGKAWIKKEDSKTDGRFEPAVANYFVREEEPYSYLASTSGQWTIDIDEKSTTRRQPEITIKPSIHWYGFLNYKPAIWYVAELNKGEIDAGGITYWATTLNAKTTSTLNYTWNRDYKNCSGSLTWSRINGNEILPTPFDGGRIEIKYGWDDGAPVGLAINDFNIFGWTPPECKQAKRTGDVTSHGYMIPEVTFGSFDFAKLGDKKNQMIDVRQAGGMNLGDFVRMVGNRLGIVSTRIYIDPDLEDLNIPVDEIPSNPYLPGNDGDSWESYIKNVEDVMNIRFCWDKTKDYTIWVDRRPEWVGNWGDIKYILNEDGKDEDIIFEISSTYKSSDYRNFLKGEFGSKRGKEVFYEIDPYAVRKLIAQDDFPVYIADQDLGKENIIGKYVQNHRAFGLYSRNNLGLQITWTMQMRPDLKVDDFVYVAKAEQLTRDASIPGVFQIIQHSISIDCDSLDGTSTFTAIYVGEIILPSFMKGFNISLN